MIPSSPAKQLGMQGFTVSQIKAGNINILFSHLTIPFSLIEIK
jgi:hypothetical protein